MSNPRFYKDNRKYNKLQELSEGRNDDPGATIFQHREKVEEKLRIGRKRDKNLHR